MWRREKIRGFNEALSLRFKKVPETHTHTYSVFLFLFPSLSTAFPALMPDVRMSALSASVCTALLVVCVVWPVNPALTVSNSQFPVSFFHQT